MNCGRKAHAVRLHNLKWTVRAIAEKLGENPRTVRTYLEGRKGYPGFIIPAHSAGARVVTPSKGAMYGYVAPVTLPTVSILRPDVWWEGN